METTSPTPKPVRKVILPVFLEVEVAADDELEAEVLASDRITELSRCRLPLVEGVQITGSIGITVLEPSA